MTKNNPGEYDCYAKAKPDEPMFVLLARDEAASALVLLWTMILRMKPVKDAQLDEKNRKIAEAEKCADEMIKYYFDKNIQLPISWVRAMRLLFDSVLASSEMWIENNE